jgi:hypothetical protein
MAIATEADLKRQQAENLWWTGHSPLESEAGAIRFLKSVRIALRYNITTSLPLAGMHKAAGDVRRSTEFSNALLATGEAIETNTIAERLVLLHRSIAPAVYRLRRRDRNVSLSSNAERALSLIQKEGHASSGDVRRHLGVYGMDRPDPGDLALAELQREFQVDRGPASIPKNGIPYLSPEGYPYRMFAKANADVVRAAGKLKVDEALCVLLEGYLEAAVFVTPRKLASMFRLLITAVELESFSSKKIEMTKKLWIWRGK